MSEARKHHYLPQAYLKNFSIEYKNKQLFVLDGSSNKSYVSSILDLAQRRDFNRVEIDGYDPNFIEKHMATFESKLAASIKNIINGGVFLKETKDYILTFIALAVVRSPQMREHFSGFLTTTVDKIMDISLSSEEIWNKCQKDSGDKHKLSFSEAKDFFESKKYKITTNKEYHIELEFKLTDVIYPYLQARNWQLITANRQENTFLTSDNPVRLDWNNPEEIPVLYRRSPGFAMKNTTVYFPLTRHHYLIGTFERPSGYLEGTPEIIAACNSHTISFAYKQVFSSDSKAKFLDDANRISTIDKIFT